MSDSVMASASPSPAHPPGDSSLWKEYKNAEGRPYWFHTVEKRSVWERPDELKSPRERAIAKTKWKEYTSGERKYYVHSETKETTWNLPQELKDLFDALPSSSTNAASPANAPQKPSPAPAIPAAVQDGQSAGSASPAAVAPGPAPGPPPSLPPSLNGPPRPVYAGPPPGFGGNNSPASGPPPPAGPAAMMGRPPPTGPAASAMPNPNFSSPQDAFRFLLESKGVTATSTWEQTMRDIVTDPLYKSLRSLAERKGVFTQYQADLRVKEQEEKQLKKQQVRPAVLDLLRKGAEAGKIKEYSSWRTVLKHFGQTEELKSATEAIGEADAMSLWDEVKKELVAAADSTVRELRHRNMDLLMSLLRTFEADATTRWRDADRTVRESSEWKQDAHLSSMDVSDMIIVFEEYIRSIEREESDRRKEVEKMRVRNERKRREVFRKWMEEERADGWIHSKTTWEDVYKRIQNDERFTSMLGQRGSSPLDLFLDVLDTCHKSIESRTAAVEGLIKLGGAGGETQSSSRSSSITTALVQEGTTWEQFTGKVQAGLERARQNGEADKWTAVAQEDQELKLVYEELLSVAQRANREARKRHERHLRHLIDDARYGLKKSADDTLLRQAEEAIPYDEVASILNGLGSREWRKLDEDLQDETERLEAKKTTWEKFCRRQKEKAEERKAAAASAPPPIDDSRDRGDRARRREDRGDRRRGEAMDYTNGSTSDARGSDRRLRRGADDNEVEEGEEFNSSSSRKRSRRDVDGGGETRKSSIPPGTSTGRPVVSAGGGAGEEDDDKEEGEL